MTTEPEWCDVCLEYEIYQLAYWTGELAGETLNLCPHDYALFVEEDDEDDYMEFDKEEVMKNAAELARDEALRQVEEGTEPSWATQADARLKKVCQAMPKFTSENLWETLPKPPEARALGPVMLRGVKNGWCTPVGMVKCTMPTRHATWVTEYESLILGTDF